MFQLKFTIVYNSLSVFAFFCLHDCSVAIMLPLSYHAESTWTCTIICDCTDCTVFVKKQSRCSGIFNNPETSPKHTYDTHTHMHIRSLHSHRHLFQIPYPLQATKDIAAGEELFTRYGNAESTSQCSAVAASGDDNSLHSNVAVRSTAWG